MVCRWSSVVAIVLLATASAQARPPHKQSLKRHYGDRLVQKLNACATCHLSREQAPDPAAFDAEYPPHNSFGVRLSELGAQLEQATQPNDIASRLRAVAAEDADGDGVPNELEVLTGRFPGDPQDKPSAEELSAAADTIRQFAATQAGYRWEPFRPIVRPTVPPSPDLGWVRNPIDAFVAVEHAAQGLTPRPEAARHVLLRRVSIDLTGLPPTRDEMQAFLADSSPNAYERVVDQLLASPRYGERWGRHWMDVWRYSDWAGWTDGKQIRDSQPHIWRWRDWIVESLNADRGYDQMLTDMLAADELHADDPSALRATGYLARNYKMLSRETWLQDTVLHTAQAFLGVTLGCARCHDHMYDLIEQDEYYQFRAIFEPHNVRLDRIPGQPDTAQDGLARVFDADPAAATYLFERGDDRKPDKDHPLQPGVPRIFGQIDFNIETASLPATAYYPGLAPHVQQETLAAAEAEATTAQAALATARSALAQAQQAAPPVPEAVAQAASAATLAEKTFAAAMANVTFIQARTAADRAKYTNPPAADANDLALAAAKAERELAVLNADVAVLKAEQALNAANAALKPDDQPTMQAAADAEKKLTEARSVLEAADKARAEATSNYSPLGPVYPMASTGRRTALARWITDRRNPLAARVAANHIWLRHFGRALVASTFDFGAYGQPPTHPALVDWLAAELMDPSVGPADHAWSMKHLHRLIVTSATYRMASTPDTSNLALDPDNRFFWRATSRRMEAEAVRDGVLYVCGELDPAMGGADIDYQLGLQVKRRSIYFRHAQEKQMEFLKMFDSAAVTECYERKDSVIPQQALALANSELSLVQARKLARTLAAECGGEPAKFVVAVFEQVLARPITAEEQQTCEQFIEQQTQLFAANSQRVAATAGDAADASKPSADPALRACENLVHVLLNHNDFVTIR